MKTFNYSSKIVWFFARTPIFWILDSIIWLHKTCLVTVDSITQPTYSFYMSHRHMSNLCHINNNYRSFFLRPKSIRFQSGQYFFLTSWEGMNNLEIEILGSEIILGQKSFWVGKNLLGSKKILRPKKFWAWKNYWVLEILWDRKNVGPKKMVGSEKMLALME